MGDFNAHYEIWYAHAHLNNDTRGTELADQINDSTYGLAKRRHRSQVTPPTQLISPLYITHGPDGVSPIMLKDLLLLQPPDGIVTLFIWLKDHHMEHSPEKSSAILDEGAHSH